MGAVSTCRLMPPHVQRQRGSRIVNIPTASGKTPKARSLPLSVSRTAKGGDLKAHSARLVDERVRHRRFQGLGFFRGPPATGGVDTARPRVLRSVRTFEMYGHWMPPVPGAVAHHASMTKPPTPVRSIAQMVAHEQTAALGLVQDVPGTAMRFLGVVPLSIDRRRPRPSARPPALGEHTRILFGNPEG